jgi:hypothetical protein
MITIKEFLEIIDYRITDGGQYLWNCFGPTTYYLNHWNGLHDKGGFDFSMVFDTKDHTVYSVTADDYTNRRCYRLINPAYMSAYKAEAESRGIDYKNAWDDINYIDLELVADYVNKAKAIFLQQPYDTRVQIEFDINDGVLLQLFKLAHEQDITMNQYVEHILRDEISRLKDNR